MPEPTDPPAKPLRTWRPMAAWTAGILLALGLAWFVGAVVVPYFHVRAVVIEYDENNAQETAAEDAISRLGGPQQAVSRLSHYLRLPDRMAPHRAAAAWILGHCGSSATPVLTEALADKSGEVRKRAAGGLGEIGPPAEAAIPALVKALADPDENVPLFAAEALASIGPRSGRPLMSALDRGNDSTRYWAAYALGCVEPADREAIPALTKAQKDKDPDVRSAAAAALKKIRDEQPPK